MHPQPKDLPGIVSARHLLEEKLPQTQGFSLDALSGRIAELAGSCALSFAFLLVLEAQSREQPVAWITLAGRSFFPPDAAKNGVELSKLPVIHAADFRQTLRISDWVVRSGAFSLLVVDIDEAEDQSDAALGRILRLAERHQTAVVFLCHTGGLGSLVSFRAITRLKLEYGSLSGCEMLVSKDRRSASSWKHMEQMHGPPGLC